MKCEQWNLIITDRVRSTMGRLCFDKCLSFHPYICLSTFGLIATCSEWGAFLLLTQNCEVVGMPLAFTQEDFLVFIWFVMEKVPNLFITHYFDSMYIFYYNNPFKFFHYQAYNIISIQTGFSYLRNNNLNYINEVILFWKKYLLILKCP